MGKNINFYREVLDQASGEWNIDTAIYEDANYRRKICFYNTKDRAKFRNYDLFDKLASLGEVGWPSDMSESMIIHVLEIDEDEYREEKSHFDAVIEETSLDVRRIPGDMIVSFAMGDDDDLRKWAIDILAYYGLSTAILNLANRVIADDYVLTDSDKIRLVELVKEFLGDKPWRLIVWFT